MAVEVVFGVARSVLSTVVAALLLQPVLSQELFLPSAIPDRFQTAGLRNVLFIVVDDLRPDIGAYNFSLARTPNIDRLASSGLTFKRAYAQYAFCAPSRNSFMSGRRPDTTRVWNFEDDFRQVGERWSSLPEYFKRHGYATLGSGKLFHPGVPFNNDYPRSWSEEWPYFSPECTPPKCPNSTASGPVDGAHECVVQDPLVNPPNPVHNPASGKGPTLCAANTTADEARPAYQLEDQKIRDDCLAKLRMAKDSGRNFFLGCGFHKPHAPWIIPHEFYDQATPLQDIPLPKHGHAPEGMPDAAWHFPGDVHAFNDVAFNGTCNATQTRVFRRGYYAAVAYTDYNIGKVLDELDLLGLTENTAVLFFGDHGYHLGEHDTWAKMTNFEVALRIPMIIRAPWIPASAGQVTEALAEAVDFYPTLAELAGLPDPRAEGEDVNGTSLVPVLADPSATSLKAAAFSQFAKPSRENPFWYWPTPRRNETEIMGYSVRVPDWRYTAWFGFEGQQVVPVTDWILGRELYTHFGDDGDPDFDGESVNLASDPAHAETVRRLHALILDYIRLS